MSRQLISAHFNRGNETIGDATVAHVRNQCINCPLPFRLGDTSGNFIIGNDTRITLRERNEKQNSGAIFISRDTTADELFHCHSMSDGAACLPRHKGNPDVRQTKKHQ